MFKYLDITPYFEIERTKKVVSRFLCKRPPEKLFGLKFAEKIRTLLFLSVHFTNLVPMRKKSNIGRKNFDRLIA